MNKMQILLLVLIPFSLSSQTKFMIPMRDSVKLATNIYLPPDTANGPVPIVLCRTPYGRGSAGAFLDSLFAHGIGYASQDTRGRGGSEGIDSLFLDNGWGEKQDGYDTVEWLARQPWCDGKIGVYGGSAYGITGYLCAGAAPLHLVCGLVAHCASNIYKHAIYPGGCYRQEQVDSWMSHMGINYMKDLLIEHYIYDHLWDTMNLENRYEQTTVPFYHVAGWYDTFCEGNIDAFVGLQNLGGQGALGKQKIIIGPWTHGGWRTRKQGDLLYPENSVWDVNPVATQWFAHYLKGEENGINDLPPVQCYVMGACLGESGSGNEWVWFDSWPPENISHDTLFLQVDKSLGRYKPIVSDTGLTYYHNPNAPLFCSGGRNLIWGAGPKNQFWQDISSQNVVWTSDVLSEPITVVGNVRAKIYLSSDCIDTDVMVRLEDVYPNNKSFLVIDGALKVRFRQGFDHESFMTPGEIYELYVDVGNIAMMFAAGHKIRIAVSSALFPRYDKNPNTGEPFRKHTYTKIAHNKIYADNEHGSCIILPVLQSATKVTRHKDDYLVKDFVLHQNYPNPFNASTIIRFSLPRSSSVILKVFDIQGKEVATLVNEKLEPGDHQINFNATNLPSGMYFYQIQTDRSIQSKKFLVLK